MRPGLLLVDLQLDYLMTPGLDPPREQIVAATGALLRSCRQASVPVMHSWTTVSTDEDRMPHWRREGKWACVEGTPGHASPPSLRPAPGEEVFHKRFFDPFGDAELERAIGRLGLDTLIVAGIHLHACVRAAALGAYERGLDVIVAADAVSSDEPVHAAETRRWLEGRVASFLDVEDIMQRTRVAAVRR